MKVLETRFEASKSLDTGLNAVLLRAYAVRPSSEVSSQFDTALADSRRLMSADADPPTRVVYFSSKARTIRAAISSSFSEISTDGVGCINVEGQALRALVFHTDPVAAIRGSNGVLLACAEDTTPSSASSVTDPDDTETRFRILLAVSLVVPPSATSFGSGHGNLAEVAAALPEGALSATSNSGILALTWRIFSSFFWAPYLAIVQLVHACSPCHRRLLYCRGQI